MESESDAVWREALGLPPQKTPLSDRPRTVEWRRWYHNGGAGAQRQRMSQTAADRAQSRLCKKYADEYRQLIDEEREALGLPPSKRSPGPEKKATISVDPTSETRSE